MSLLVASLGTPYEIQTAGTILFLEDVAEKLYRIDRMLMQLKLAGKLADVRGIVFGEMLDCRLNLEPGYRLEELVLRLLGGLGVPVAFGLRSALNRSLSPSAMRGIESVMAPSFSASFFKR